MSQDARGQPLPIEGPRDEGDGGPAGPDGRAGPAAQGGLESAEFIQDRGVTPRTAVTLAVAVGAVSFLEHLSMSGVAMLCILCIGLVGLRLLMQRRWRDRLTREVETGPGEVVLAHGPAGHGAGWHSRFFIPYGWLYVSHRRLWFRPILNPSTPALSIPLDSITGLARVSGLDAVLAPGFVVVNASGRTRIATNRAAAWLEAIARARSKAQSA